jgi:3-methyladenine DNA glycosylase AlkD
MRITESTVAKAIMECADPKIAAHSQGFFKTGRGEYGEGDKFLGIRVPDIRKLVKKYKEITLEDTFKLLQSGYHEIRLFALLSLVMKFKKGDMETQENIYTRYLKNTKFINNWDLVDSSAHLIIGPYLMNRDKSILNQMAVSDYLFDRRIAIMSTFWFIKNNEFGESLDICSILLHDTEDLIQKAVGWMLREIGNRDLSIEENFLKMHYKTMPRTMLRYAIEKFDETKRKSYLKGEIKAVQNKYNSSI